VSTREAGKIPSVSARLLAVGRLLTVVSGLLVLVAGFIAATEGVSTSIAGLRVSAHNPIRPAIYGVLCAIVATVIYRLNAGGPTLAEELAWWRGLVVRIVSVLRAHARGRLAPLLIVAAAALWIDVVQWWRGAPLWLDEEMIALNFRDRSFAGLTGSLWLGQSAPLAWLWLERAVLLLLGPGERGLRIVPLLFGLGTTVAAALIAKRWLSPAAGVLLVVLTAAGSSTSHYRFELKHYSADVFWALLLPAAAVWATEAGSPGQRRRRQLTFAAMAGAALWTSYGALFVAPACLLLIVLDAVRSRKRPALRDAMLAVVVWSLLFAANYAVSLRHTHENDFLRRYWNDRVPPASEGPVGRLLWIGEQLPELGRTAGGTQFPILLFSVGIAGLLLAPDRRLAMVYGAVPLTGVVLAVTRLVPVYERFSLWVFPALYLGLTFALDRGIRWSGQGLAAKRADLLLGGALTCVAALPVSGDIAHHGWNRLELGGPDSTNHGMDDKRGVAWLMGHRQPGDAIVTTRLGWPAIWWYGGISLADHPDGRLPDGTALYALSHEPAGRTCSPIGDALQGHRRILFYVSFPDLPDGVFPWLEREMLGLGTLAARKAFTSATWAAVVKTDDASRLATRGADQGGPPGGGCVQVRLARRW
jgi:hypothetical protein